MATSKPEETITGQPEKAAGIEAQPGPLPDKPRKRTRLRDWAFRIRQREAKSSAAIRCLLRILFIMDSEFRATEIPLRSAALTYSILLSLVPVLALSTAVLKGLGSDNQLKIAAYKLIDQMEPDHQTKLLPKEKATKKGEQEAAEAKPEPPATQTAPQKTPRKPEQSLADDFRLAVDTIFNYVDRTNFATLGAFGIIGLIYAVIMVLGTVEDAMNAIWHTRGGRSLLRKLMDYVALVVLLPVSINIALAGDAVLANRKMIAALTKVLGSTWIITMILKLLPFLFVVLSLMVMYMFFPNVKVKTLSAFTGAFFASIFWFLVQGLYIVLQVNVAKYNAIYGSFATLPLFLIWANLGWMFILLGASLAYAVQNHNQYQLPGRRQSPKQQLQLAFDILDSAYRDFETRTPSTLESLCREHPNELIGNIEEIIDRLVQGRLLYRIENEEAGLVPALTANDLDPSEVVRLFLGTEETPTPGGNYSTQVIQAAEGALAKDAFPTTMTREPEETTPSSADHRQPESAPPESGNHAGEEPVF